MHFYVGKFPVVKAGSFEPRLVELESQWFDQMQLGSGVCTPLTLAGKIDQIGQEVLTASSGTLTFPLIVAGVPAGVSAESLRCNMNKH